MPSCSAHKNPHQADEITIHKMQFGTGFTTLPNCTLQDQHLSFSAKGLLAYIMSLPPGWQLHSSHLAQLYQGDLRGNGRDAILAILHELKKRGYVQYVRSRKRDGTFAHRYDVYPITRDAFESLNPFCGSKTTESAILDQPKPLSRNGKGIQKKMPERVKPDLVKPDVYKGKREKKIGGIDLVNDYPPSRAGDESLPSISGDVNEKPGEIPQAVQPKGKPEESAKTPVFRRRTPMTGNPLTVIHPLLSTEAKPIIEKAKTVNDSLPSSPEKAKTVNDSPLRGEVSESLPFLSADLSSKGGENIQETQKDTERPRESKMDREATLGLANAKRALKREQKDVLDAPAEVSLSCGDDNESLPFRSVDKKDTEAPQESTIDNEATRGLAGIKYPLKREQIPLLEALTVLDLGCSLKTLYILIRSHTPQALADAMHHLRHEDTQGKKIKNRIGLLRAILAGKISPVTGLVAKNKKLCVEKAREMGWHSLDIREKCVVCTATHKEIQLNMAAEEFFNALKSLYELGRSYRKSAPASFDVGYDDGSEED